MEGVANEAASLAGHLKLSNLCWIYDDNHITIEGDTELAFSEDVATRFKGLGWNVIRCADANDAEALLKAYKKFLRTNDKPTLIIVRSHIGYGSPHKQDTHKAHGEPLGDDEIRLTKEVLRLARRTRSSWCPTKPGSISQPASPPAARSCTRNGKRSSPSTPRSIPSWPPSGNRWIAASCPTGWDADMPDVPGRRQGHGQPRLRRQGAQRRRPARALADRRLGRPGPLDHDACKRSTAPASFEPGNYGGRNFHFGIREHGMAAALNGMALSNVRPFGATFFVVHRLLQPSIRLSAISHLPAIYIFTHDSIGVGEDGPTHQPIEHLAAIRAVPRADHDPPRRRQRSGRSLAHADAAQRPPGRAGPDAAESADARSHEVRPGQPAWPRAPTCWPIRRAAPAASDPDRHRQRSFDSASPPTSSSPPKASPARVVSMPCWELFDAQDEAYRNSVLPPAVTARVACEAGIRQGWDRYIGTTGRFVGMTTYGASAPGPACYKYFNITPEHVVEEAKAAIRV